MPLGAGSGHGTDTSKVPRVPVPLVAVTIVGSPAGSSSVVAAKPSRLEASKVLDVPVTRCGQLRLVARQRPLHEHRRRDVLDVGDGLRAVDGHAAERRHAARRPAAATTDTEGPSS